MKQNLGDAAVKQGLAGNKRLVKSHYENFSIGSFLLPKSIRSDLSNIYAFCRLADDFADEVVEGVSRSDKLDAWSAMLHAAVDGRAPTPLFAALAETIERRSLPLTPFLDLIAAFKQDLIVVRYENWADLFDYCRLSANPVGRLVLAVCGRSNEQYFAYSDKICTALQLVNHWQDVREDLQRGRIYIPGEILRKFDIDEQALAEKVPARQFKNMMLHLCDFVEVLFHEGKPLIDLVGKPLAPQLYLYYGGGNAALNAIRRADGDVITRRCRVGNADRFRLMVGATLKWAGI